jgi:hypothetical protein
MGKPIAMQRAPELVPLSHDHHRALVLARRCRWAVAGRQGLSPAAVWAEVREVFAAELEPHFRIEETLLLPALEAVGEAEAVRRTRADHEVLRGMIAAESLDADALERFGEVLDAHVRFEERELFEVAQARLTRAQLGAVEVACRRTSRACATADGQDGAQ